MLGPVFRFELITTARRKRYYVARVLYGLFLLFSLGSQYGAGEWSRYAAMNLNQDSIAEMNRFAQQMFAALAWSQGVALLCLVPALLAGVIGSTPYVARALRAVHERAAAANATWQYAVEAMHVAGLTALLLLCTTEFAAGTYNPFIYFRF